MQLVSISHLFQRIKLPISTNFHGGIIICCKVITMFLIEAWNLVPQSKNSTRGHFSACAHIPSFSAYQTAHLSNFHGGTIICCKVITMFLIEAWNLVPQSKNSTRGHFSACVHILSFSAYQTAHLYQVSCWYHNLHDYCNNLPHYIRKMWGALYCLSIYLSKKFDLFYVVVGVVEFMSAVITCYIK